MGILNPRCADFHGNLDKSARFLLFNTNHLLVFHRPLAWILNITWDLRRFPRKSAQVSFENSKLDLRRFCVLGAGPAARISTEICTNLWPWSLKVGILRGFRVSELCADFVSQSSARISCLRALRGFRVIAFVAFDCHLQIHFIVDILICVQVVEEVGPE